MRYLFVLITYAFGFASCAQQPPPVGEALQPQTETYPFQLGETPVMLSKITYGSAQPYIFVQLHHNEATAGAAAERFLQQHGGVLLRIENGGDRFVSFRLKGTTYQFDPNRMFTPSGIAISLRLLSTYRPEAAREVAQFSAFLLDHLPDTALVIAVHNNTPDNYTIHSYRQDRDLIADAAALHINEDLDADNFFLTTDEAHFQQLQARKQNVVLQHNEQAKDDGSLSILYGRQNKAYINVEAEYGHLEAQTEMLRLLKTLLFHNPI